MAAFDPPAYYFHDYSMHAEPKIEEPIFGVKELGTTVPEQDPSGRFKNIVQGIQANIRRGAGTMQVMWMTPPENALGGRPKSYGKEVREAIREIALANKVNIKGFEMPTSTMNNLSGFDHQRLEFSDEKRQLYLDEVKDAIRFAADATQGGGIDIVSWEYPREINDAGWNKDKRFYKVGEHKIGMVVDDREGKVMSFRKDEIQRLPVTYIDEKGEEQVKVNDQGEIEMEQWDWKRFQDEAKRQTEENFRRGIKKEVAPEKVFLDKRLTAQIQNLKGMASYYQDMAESHRENAEEGIPKKIQDIRQELAKETDEAKKKEMQEVIEKLQKRIPRELERYQEQMRSAAGNLTQASELEERRNHLRPVGEYAKHRSFDSYAKAGVLAMQETHNNPHAKQPVYVGPEIGWPQYYGGHPDEFEELITNARKRMMKLMIDPKRTNEFGQYVDENNKPVEDPNKAARNPYFRPGVSEKEAKREADTHIKGMFDTSHLGMWLAHFPGQTIRDKKTGKMRPPTEDERIEQFNKWYMEKVEKLADPKKNLVGGIQLVDSQSAAHGHLPPGQGIFPVTEAAKKFKEKGYKGYLVSEGHEEEKFGEGRIMTKTWQALGARTGGGQYFGGPAQTWRNVEHSYFGRTYSPNMMVGSYAPSNDFKLWSEVPLE